MNLEKLKKHAEQFPPNHCCFSPEDVLPLISEIERLQAAFDKARTDAHTAQFDLAEFMAKNLKVVAVVEESERDGCDPFVAKIRWLFNPVPEGEELYWSHPPEKQPGTKP